MVRNESLSTHCLILSSSSSKFACDRPKTVQTLAGAIPQFERIFASGRRYGEEKKSEKKNEPGK